MSGNGVDLGQTVATLANVMDALRHMRADASEFRAEMHSFRAETQRDLAAVKRDLAGLRQTVAEYHASVLGHGVLISEPDERLRRVEAQLGLPRAV